MATLQEIRQQYPQYADMPDQQLADGMYKKFYSDMPREQFDAKLGLGTSDAETVKDIAKSGGIGVAKGAIGMAGLYGDVQNYGNMAKDWVREKVHGPATPEQKQIQSAIAASQRAPTGAEIQGGIEKLTGPFYKPQTVPGEFAQTAGEFLTPSLLGKGKAVEKAVNFGLVPALASETAGQLTKGTTAEPYARMGAAVVGNIPGAMKQGPRPGIMTKDELKQAAGHAYDVAENANVIISPQSWANAVRDIKQEAAQLKFHPKLKGHHDINVALESMEELVGQPITFKSMEQQRRILGAVANGSEPDARRIAGALKEKLDDYAMNVGPADIMAGTVAEAKMATNALALGREFWKRSAKSELIENAIVRAERRTASTGSGGNIDNATRQNIRGILDNPKKARNFTAEEKAAMEKVVRGGGLTQDLLRLVGKLSPRGSGLMAVAGGGAAYVNPLLAIPFVAGVGAKSAADALTRRNAQYVEELVRAGGKMPRSARMPDTRKVTPAMIEALMAGNR